MLMFRARTTQHVSHTGFGEFDQIQTLSIAITPYPAPLRTWPTVSSRKATKPATLQKGKRDGNFLNLLDKYVRAKMYNLVC